MDRFGSYLVIAGLSGAAITALLVGGQGGLALAGTALTALAALANFKNPNA